MELKISEWETFKRGDFEYNGHEAVIIYPKNANKENRWIWRTEFFGAFDAADTAMVEEGWHLVYYKISNMYGSPKAVELMAEFHDFIVSELGLYPKGVLFGFSRGGLYAVNYAAKYPFKVAQLYLDAPVLDIKSWPGGLGNAPRCENEWEQCKNEYGITEEEAAKYSDVPLNKAQVLYENNIPIIIVAGGKDEVVPFEENSQIFIEKYKALGGNIKLILKPDCGHHPHSLEDVTPIVEFLIKK